MPSLGDVRRDDHHGVEVWHACIDCGKGRWVRVRKHEVERLRCNSCKCKGERNPHFQKQSPNWKGVKHHARIGNC